MSKLLMRLQHTLQVWPYLMLMRFALITYVLFYANDGRKEYIPKAKRTSVRLTRYLAFLRAWTRHWGYQAYLILSSWYHHYKWRWVASRFRMDTERPHNNCHYIKVPQGRLPKTLLAWEVILAMESKTNKSERTGILDTDSRAIGIDNRCSAYLSGYTDDFIGELTPTDKIIKGFGGTQTTNVSRGTALIRLEDDTGRIHTFKLPNSYYVPGCNVRLLSPQHWSQQLRRQRQGPAYSTTTGTEVTLTAKGFTKTIPLDPSTNVATCRSAPGYDRFVAFCVEVGCDQVDKAMSMAALLTGTNGTSDSNTDGPMEDAEFRQQGLLGKDNNEPIPDEAEVNNKSHGRSEDELLEYHLRFGHAPFKKLQIMAREGVIPKRLARCRQPLCAACMFGKATKRPWRQKTPVNKDEAYKPTKPGEIVSVDQLKSPTPGLIAQITGALTTKRYEYVTVFVDNFSGYSFAFLQKTSSGEETLQAKEAFERLCKTNGIHVQHYHADNGIFKAHLWVENSYIRTKITVHPCGRSKQALSSETRKAHPAAYRLPNVHRVRSIRRHQTTHYR